MSGSNEAMLSAPPGIAFLRGGVPDDEAGQRAEDVQSSGQGEARGRIVEEGTNDELLRPGGRYAEFWTLSRAPAAMRPTRPTTDRAARSTLADEAASGRQ